MIGRYGYLAARILLASVFLFSGYGKLTDGPVTAGDIATFGLPFPVLSAMSGLLMVALREGEEVRADWTAVTGWRRRK